MTFYIPLFDDEKNDFVKYLVEGKLIPQLFFGKTCFVHKTHPDELLFGHGKYSVSELETGFKITSGETKNIAISSASTIISEKGKDEFFKKIRSAKRRVGILNKL